MTRQRSLCSAFRAHSSSEGHFSIKLTDIHGTKQSPPFWWHYHGFTSGRLPAQWQGTGWRLDEYRRSRKL